MLKAVNYFRDNKLLKKENNELGHPKVKSLDFSGLVDIIDDKKHEFEEVNLDKAKNSLNSHGDKFEALISFFNDSNPQYFIMDSLVDNYNSTFRVIQGPIDLEVIQFLSNYKNQHENYALVISPKQSDTKKGYSLLLRKAEETILKPSKENEKSVKFYIPLKLIPDSKLFSDSDFIALGIYNIMGAWVSQVTKGDFAIRKAKEIFQETLGYEGEVNSLENVINHVNNYF